MKTLLKNTVATEPRPASTVVLLRDGAQGVETLLLKRNKALIFAGGLWVFPGGAIDLEDLEAAGGEEKAASRLAAAREAQEESGLQPALDDMLQLSHWTTPVVEPKRFSTWFYVAPVASDADVVIDGSEIHDSQWISIKDAMLGHEHGDLGMFPPTYLTLLYLSRYHTVADVLTGEAETVPAEVLPVMGKANNEMVLMLEGDAGYDSGDASKEGPQHRATLRDGYWQYVVERVDEGFSHFNGKS
jgi:8-oxo-dGTP pyrophosphatase MutT (NUDIX family)